MIENPEFLKLTQNGEDSNASPDTEAVTLNGGGKVKSEIYKCRWRGSSSFTQQINF